MTYQFKIQLEGFKNPKVWRQVIVPSDYSFTDFHKVIAIAFGQESNILFIFSPFGKNSKPVIIPVDLFFEDGSNIYATTARLSTIFGQEGQTYVYSSFSNKWQHNIILEKIINDETLSPYCLAGEGEYPPESCIDCEDYGKMKQILSDKKHPKYEEIKEWLELGEYETWEEKYKFSLSEVNEQLKNTDPPIKLFRKYTIVKHDTFNEEYGLNSFLWEIIDNHREIMLSNDNWKDKNTLFYEVEKLVHEYPHIPHFKNTLTFIYEKMGEKKRSFKMRQQIFEEYPNYVVTRCSLINQYLSDKRLDKALELLGENFDLSELYPTRNGKFTEVEIFNYHFVAFQYFLKKKDEKNALKHLDFLEYLFPDSTFRNLRTQLTLLNLDKMREEMRDEMPDKTKKYKSVKVIPEKVAFTSKVPDFENPEVKVLYKQGDYIKKSIFYQIIELPRESVIRDMKKILIDSIARFDYFNKNSNIALPDASIHALCILSVMKAEESLDTLFTVLRQNKDYYEMWYGDILTEDFWQFIYAIGQNSLDRLKDFVLEPNRYTFVRSEISKAVMQIALHQEERREEVIKWYEEVLQYMLDHRNDDRVFDHDVYSMWMDDLIDLLEREELPIVKRLYDEDLITDAHSQSFIEIKKMLATPPLDYKRDVFTSIDQYYDLWEKWTGDNNVEENDFTPAFKTPFTEKKAITNTITSKTGRNDPCPCGSGKKYKKCCSTNK